MIKVVRAKLHGITVTESDLNYHGSITLDPLICQQVGIMPLEYLDIWNKNSSARIQTYAIYGKPGSGCCILNGAAARTCQMGDEIIICASSYIDPEKLLQLQPLVLTFTSQNKVDQVMSYEVGLDEANHYSFSIKDKTPQQQGAETPIHHIPNLDKMKDGLKEANLSNKEIADFISKYTTV